MRNYDILSFEKLHEILDFIDKRENYELKGFALVALQGSRTYGSAREDSDYDVYVVSIMQPEQYFKVNQTYKKHSDFTINNNINVQHFDFQHFLHMVGKSNYMAFANLVNVVAAQNELLNDLINFSWNWRTLLHQTIRSAKFFIREFEENCEAKSLNLFWHRYLLSKYIVEFRVVPPSHNIEFLHNVTNTNIYQDVDVALNWISGFNIGSVELDDNKSDINEIFRRYAL